MFKFEVPSLMVGTLDSLMTLSDDLGKTDGIVESIVRKIEKTGVELAGKKGSDLTVGGVPAPRRLAPRAQTRARIRRTVAQDLHRVHPAGVPGGRRSADLRVRG